MHDARQTDHRRRDPQRETTGEAETQQEGQRMRQGPEEWQSITNADRMHQRPPESPTGSRIARGAEKDTHSHTWPLRRSTGHDRRHRVRSVHPSHTMPTEGAQMPHRARRVAQGTASHPPHQEEPQPPRMRRACNTASRQSVHNAQKRIENFVYFDDAA